MVVFVYELRKVIPGAVPRRRVPSNAQVHTECIYVSLSLYVYISIYTYNMI